MIANSSISDECPETTYLLPLTKYESSLIKGTLEITIEAFEGMSYSWQKGMLVENMLPKLKELKERIENVTKE